MPENEPSTLIGDGESRAVQQLLSQSDLFVNWLRNRPRNQIVGTEDESPIQRFLSEQERLIMGIVVVDGMCADIYPNYGDDVVTIMIPEWAQLLSSVLDENPSERVITAGRCRAALRVAEKMYRKRRPARARRVFAQRAGKQSSVRLDGAVGALVHEYLPCVKFLAEDLVIGQDDARAAVERYISETVSESYAAHDVRAAAAEITARISKTDASVGNRPD